MLEKLLGIGQLQNTLKQTRIHHFNNTLPILIEVLKKTKANHYLLMVGNKMLETKSLKELEIGARYFALMKSTSTGGIMLTALKAQPKIPQGALEFLHEEMQDSILEKTKIKEFQEYALDKMMHAKTKDDFLNWGFFLFGLQKKILSFWVNDGDEKTFFQLKSQKQSIIFYALFPHLGELNGRIYKYKNEVCLDLKVGYESIALFLKEKEEFLSGIDQLRISVENCISPLFCPTEQLLDLKI